MEDCVVSKAFLLMRWSPLLLLTLVVPCKAQWCSFSNYTSDATVIDMKECGFTTVNTAELTRFTLLEALELHNNDLTVFTDVSAVGPTLKTLNLGNNQLTHINENVLIHLNALRNLRLYDNYLTTFPDVSAVGTTLRLLNLANNQIKHISNDVLIHLTTLKTLKMGGNPLTTFPDLTAVGTTLQALELPTTLLNKVSKGAFLTLVTLEELDLFDNPSLTRIPHPDKSLGNIIQLWIYDTGVSHLPPILHENIAALELDIQRSVDLCLCENAWLKQEGPNMAIFQYDDADCDGQLWSSMTLHDMIAKCRQERLRKNKQLTQAIAAPTQMSLSPFLLHSMQRVLNEIRCAKKCRHTPGCVSYYWHGPKSGPGDCVLIAPGSNISVSSVPEGDLPVWTYVALT